MAEFLHAEGLHKTFITPRRRVEVLRGCDLRLAQGETLAILGASGSGKSTLLHLLGTLDRADAGRVLFRGEDLRAAGAERCTRFRREELGFIFQFHHLLPEFSALENVALPALIARRPRRPSLMRAGELLERVGLAERSDHRPAELSGGEQQRVAVARALMGRPCLLLADEPTGNLDAATGAEVADLLFSLGEEAGASLVLVTHERALARRAAHSYLLENGVLKAL